MKFTVAAVSCMIEKETGKIIMDPDSTQLKVSIIMVIGVMSYFFNNKHFSEELFVYRMQRRKLHMHLTVLTKTLYAATVSVDSLKASSYPLWINVNKLVNLYLIFIGKLQKNMQI